MKFNQENKILYTFNFSSLTDIVMLLLIFFLLSSAFILQPGIKVKLPEAAVTEAHSEKSIYVAIDRNNNVYLNGERVPLGQLGARVRKFIVDPSKQVVVIQADKAVAWDMGVRVMDICKLAGAQKFVIATEKKK
ncbi:MAG: biopolymer transporter ExbD [Methanobacteriota archaeon]|nr:MAG: biopolymer transporter ExbD [Euryarchaeota archaeon]RMG19775.1 MAG: biopolymer transporter ExbD [Euryarchaeota archaeon]